MENKEKLQEIMEYMEKYIEFEMAVRYFVYIETNKRHKQQYGKHTRAYQKGFNDGIHSVLGFMVTHSKNKAKK